MRYFFRDLSFDVPEGLLDQSVVVLVDQQSVALTVAREPRESTLAAYVDTAIAELREQMTGYKLEQREQREVAACPAVVITHAAVTPEGQKVAQQQAYIEVGGDVLVVTATAPQGDTAKAAAAFNGILGSLRFT